MQLNHLYKTRAYLVGQMQYCDGQPWREKAEKELKKLGVIVFNPYNHPFVGSSQENSSVREKVLALAAQDLYDEATEIVNKVRREDLRMVDICDFIFCYINPAFPTCGTWEELFWANRLKKPIFLCIEGGKEKCPFWMYGVMPHKYIYSSVEEALKVIHKIDSGKKPLDSDRWRLLRKEYR